MPLTAQDVMQKHVVTVSPDEPLESIQRLLFEEGIHGAPVVDDQGRVLGMIASSDLLRAAVEEGESASPAEAHLSYLREAFEESGSDWADAPASMSGLFGDRVASDAMTNEALCVETGASIPEVARTLRENKVHRVLVVEDDSLRGIISTYDLVALLESD